MLGNNWQRGLILICLYICVLLSSCQTPYRDIIEYTDPQQPECAKIIDDGFDHICFVYEMMEVPVPVEVLVEVPGPVRVEVVKEIVERIVKVPVVQVKVVDRIVEVPVEVVREVDRIVEVPVEVIREVEKIVEVPGPVQIQIQKVNSFTGNINIPPAYDSCSSTCHAVVKDNRFIRFDVDIDGDGVVDRSVEAFEHLE